MCDAYHGVCVHLLVHMSMVRSEEEWCMWCWVTIVVLVLWSTLSQTIVEFCLVFHNWSSDF